jgi:DNA-binding PadR family transcriptional regulator
LAVLDEGAYKTLSLLELTGPAPMTAVHGRSVPLLRLLVEERLVTVRDATMEITDEGRAALARYQEERDTLDGIVAASSPDSSAVPVNVVRDELHELLELRSPKPAELRRTAEVVEALFGDAEARVWWQRAALAGDRDALDYIRVMDEEDDDE